MKAFSRFVGFPAAILLCTLCTSCAMVAIGPMSSYGIGGGRTEYKVAELISAGDISELEKFLQTGSSGGPVHLNPEASAGLLGLSPRRVCALSSDEHAELMQRPVPWPLWTHYQDFLAEDRKIIDLLIEHGADPNALSTPTGGSLIADLATHGYLAGWWTATVSGGTNEAILEPTGIDIKRDSFLHDETSRRCIIEYRKGQIEYLIKKGADPNLRFPNGQTALHLLTKEVTDYKPLVGNKTREDSLLLWNSEMVTFLLQQKADINARDVEGRTPLSLLKAGKREWRIKFREFLVAQGAKE